MSPLVGFCFPLRVEAPAHPHTAVSARALAGGCLNSFAARPRQRGACRGARSPWSGPPRSRSSSPTRWLQETRRQLRRLCWMQASPLSRRSASRLACLSARRSARVGTLNCHALRVRKACVLLRPCVPSGGPSRKQDPFLRAGDRLTHGRGRPAAGYGAALCLFFLFSPSAASGAVRTLFDQADLRSRRVAVRTPAVYERDCFGILCGAQGTGILRQTRAFHVQARPAHTKRGCGATEAQGSLTLCRPASRAAARALP